MQVPFYNLRAANQIIGDELEASFRKVINSGYYILGGELEAFENEFASYCGVSYGIGVGNGLDALVLILRGYGIGYGDEVIVPAHTFIATWLAVSLVGAQPVPVDVDPNTLNIDARKIDQAITRKTRAILGVHLYGQPFDATTLINVARRHGLKVIEDAAQAHGARFRGNRTGSLGDAAAFSLYPAKNLGALGDGGIVVTSDENLKTQVTRLRNYGSVKKYQHEVRGYNSRLDELQAAFLRVKLRSLDTWNTRRREIASHYLRELEQINQIVLPKETREAEHVWHLFTIRVPEREKLQQYLLTQEIFTQIHYPIPPHLSEAYRGPLWPQGSFPITEEACSSLLSLPIGPTQTDDQTEFVIAALRNFFDMTSPRS